MDEPPASKQAQANRVLFDIPHSVREPLLAHDLALAEAARPYIQLAFQAEGKTSLDELHGFFKRDLRSRRDESVEMVGHDHECVQKELPLTVIVENGSLEQFRCGRDLKKAATLRRRGGDWVCSSFSWGNPHVCRITEQPGAKATSLAGFHSGA